MILKVKIFLKYILYFLINFLIKPSKRIRPKSILLIRLDAIGDYVLFRNFIEVLKKSEKYKNYNITLVGNKDWRDLSEKFDGKYIDNFIWIDRKKFTKNFVYRYRKLREITSTGYEIVLNPRYSREFFYGDTIVKLVQAKEKIGSIGDFSNIRKWQKKSSDKYYTKLVPAKNGIMFEFYRNKEFFENLLEKEIDIKKPYIDLQNKQINFELPDKYTVLFIGGRARYKKWSPDNFAEVGKFINEYYGLKIVICGSNDDVKEAERIKELLYDLNAYDFIGKTSLTELVFIISKAEFIVSNETLAPHIAVALNIPVVCISNGNHFGRFTPYTSEITNHCYAVFHPFIEKDLKSYEEISNRYGYASTLDINEIKPEKVIKVIKDLMNSVNNEMKKVTVENYKN